MRFGVWLTGHSIADTIAHAIWESSWCGHEVYLFNTQNNISEECINSCDAHIAYGILRKCDELYRACDRINKPWLCVDRGYFKPGHHDGYYRVSLNGTQQTTGLNRLEPDYERWDRLGIEILEDDQLGRDGLVNLVCPPTDHVQHFFMPGMDDWINCDGYIKNRLIRDKECERPLNQDFDDCNKVITFNSSVGWEALRQGIPVVSDEQSSIVGAYQKLVDKPLHTDYEARRRLFGIMAATQLTLDEMKQGKLWPLIQTLLATQTH